METNWKPRAGSLTLVFRTLWKIAHISHLNLNDGVIDWLYTICTEGLGLKASHLLQSDTCYERAVELSSILWWQWWCDDDSDDVWLIMVDT